MPPPIPIFTGRRLVVRRAGAHVRFHPLDGAEDIFARLPSGGFSFLQIRIEDLFSVRAEEEQLLAFGAFQTPLNALHFEIGPLPGGEAAAAVDALGRAFELPRVVEPLSPDEAAHAVSEPGVRWVSMRGVRRRTHFEASDFEGTMLRILAGADEPPYETPIVVMGQLSLSRREGLPPPVGYGGGYLTVMSFDLT